MFDANVPLEAYHYHTWRQRELREKSGWVTDLNFEARVDRPNWLVIVRVNAHVIQSHFAAIQECFYLARVFEVITGWNRVVGRSGRGHIHSKPAATAGRFMSDCARVPIHEALNIARIRDECTVWGRRFFD